MRLLALLVAGGLLAACTTTPVAVPRDAVLYEVPREPAVSPVPQRQAGAPGGALPGGRAVILAPQEAGADDFTRRIERAIDGPADAAPAGQALAAPVTPLGGAPAGAVDGTAASPLDDDRLNLNEYTLEQQRIDAAVAERELEEARRQLVIVQPGASVPQPVEGVNIVVFAKQTTHAVGERRYSRPVTAALNRGGACRRFATADEAQRFFLRNGGPERDPQGLDPDGDGFACGWDPEPYRRLRL